jgi:CDP-2,3-bis-(O-geranylgeranyl)-sn-glycerol synthase
MKLILVAQAFLLFLPAGIANMTPVLANKVPVLNRWNTPMDFGRTWRGMRILGDHKTWRGLVAGVFCGALVALIALPPLFKDASVGWIIGLGFALGLGALVGDAVESFFKRQLGRPSGTAWFPFDQLDYIVGGLLFALPIYVPSFALVAGIIGLYFGLHLLMSYLGYLTGFKKDPI